MQSHPDQRPSLLTDKSGPMRQRSIFEWNIAGNPHAGSSTAVLDHGTSAVASAGLTSSQAKRKPRDICVIPDEDPDNPISLDVEDEEGHPFDLMGDGKTTSCSCC